jgi:integrase/recombinase XerD
MELPLLEDFLTSVLVEKSGSKHTQKSYARDLALFAQFMLSDGSDVTRFSQTKLQTFCTGKGLGRRSQARVISTLRSYFKYLQRQGRIKELPHLEIVKHTRTLPETLTDDQIQALLKASSEGEKNEYRVSRNRCVLTLLYATGCRVSELCEVDLADVHLDTRTMKISGKGSKERVVPLVTSAVEAMNEYLKNRLFMAEPKERALIVNDRGHRPSRIDIFRWLKRWSQGAGFKKNVSPHKLRHACATQLLREGVDLRSIQTLLGHASIATTEIYTKVENSDLDETVRKHHPLSDEK